MLKLIPPGKRKNKFWVIRGRLDGHKIEKSLGVCLRKDAEEKLDELLDEYRKGKNINKNVTFADATERYIAFRKPGKKDTLSLARICEEMGDKLVMEITQNDLVQIANRLYPWQTNASKNRRIITPASAVLHYAAKNKWCQRGFFTKFPVPTAKTRFVSEATEQALLNATEGKKRLLILWLFRQGDRIGDVLKVKYEDCNLETKIISRHVSKSDVYLDFPLDDEICQLLIADGQASGFIFPWRNHTTLNKWLKPLRERLGVEFTPHRARHTLGKRLNDSGAGLKTIMQALGHNDARSSLRYQTTDIETIRQAKEKTLCKKNGKLSLIVNTGSTRRPALTA